jgi:GxxExxY protein
MTEDIISVLNESETDRYGYNDLSGNIISCCIEVHKALGPGLLESAYKESLVYELTKRNHTVKVEYPLPLIYKEVKLECGYRADIIVENKIVLEIKSVEALTDIHTAQVLTYLKLSGCTLALLINFNVLRLKDGIKRLVNNF